MARLENIEYANLTTGNNRETDRKLMGRFCSSSRMRNILPTTKPILSDFGSYFRRLALHKRRKIRTNHRLILTYIHHSHLLLTIQMRLKCKRQQVWKNKLASIIAFYTSYAEFVTFDEQNVETHNSMFVCSQYRGTGNARLILFWHDWQMTDNPIDIKGHHMGGLGR